MSESVTVVYDCMIFLQAAARPDRVHTTLKLVRDGEVNLCLSPVILAELRDVLNRPEVRSKFPALKPQEVDDFLNEILNYARMVNEVPEVFALPRDKKDEPYLNLAIAVDAHYLVTWNERHLTYLMGQDTPEGRDFCRRFPNLKIVPPPAFVREFQRE